MHDNTNACCIEQVNNEFYEVKWYSNLSSECLRNFIEGKISFYIKWEKPLFGFSIWQI